MSSVSSLLSTLLDTPALVVSVGVLVGALLIGLIVYQKSKSSSVSQNGLTGRYPSVLIYGPMHSGKTVLFYKLHNSSHTQQTQTSMNANVLEFCPNNMSKVTKTYQFCDLPGHPSQDAQIFKYALNKHHNKGMKGLIFAMDICDKTSIVDAAKKLFSLLEKRKFYKRNPKLLMLLTKKDQLHKSANILDVMKERQDAMLLELNKLRDSYSTLQSINESGEEETIFLGNDKQDLTWNDVKCEMQWGSCSAVNGQLDDVQSFLQTL